MNKGYKFSVSDFPVLLKMNKYWRTRNNFSFITETHFLRNLYFYTDLLISSYSFAISSIVYQYSYSFILHLFTSILFGYSLHIGIIFFPNLPIKLKTKQNFCHMLLGSIVPLSFIMTLKNKSKGNKKHLISAQFSFHHQLFAWN